MERNVGKYDKAVRIGVGATLLLVGLFSARVDGALKWIFIIIGAYLLVTGIAGWCPIYKATKMSTNKVAVSDQDMKDLMK